MELHPVRGLWHLPWPERQRQAAEAMQGFRSTSLSRTLWVMCWCCFLLSACVSLELLSFLSSWLVVSGFVSMCISMYLDHRLRLHRLQMALFLHGIRPARCFRCRVDLAASQSARCPRCGTQLVRDTGGTH